MALAARRHGSIRMVHASSASKRTCKGCERRHNWRLQCACGWTFSAPVGSFDGDHMEKWWREHLEEYAWRHKPERGRVPEKHVGIPVAPRWAVPINAAANAVFLFVMALYPRLGVLNLAVIAVSAWMIYSGVRHLGYGGQPVALPVPAYRRVRSVGCGAAAVRQPALWPPEEGRCFVCGMDSDVEHPSCQEWLGDWTPTVEAARTVTSAKARAL